jgi:hypothetical protein
MLCQFVKWSSHKNPKEIGSTFFQQKEVLHRHGYPLTETCRLDIRALTELCSLDYQNN